MKLLIYFSRFYSGCREAENPPRRPPLIRSPSRRTYQIPRWRDQIRSQIISDPIRSDPVQIRSGPDPIRSDPIPHWTDQTRSDTTSGRSYDMISDQIKIRSRIAQIISDLIPSRTGQIRSRMEQIILVSHNIPHRADQIRSHTGQIRSYQISHCMT